MQLIELKRAVGLALHSTFSGGWDRIRESDLGLASTTALLDRYGIAGERRERLECAPRPNPEQVEADGLPSIVIRDQKPLLPIRSLERVLEGGVMTTREWCRDLNRRVFFFTSERPLRGRGTFMPIQHYPSRCPDGPPDPAVAEITVTTSLCDIEELVRRVERWRGAERVDDGP